MYMNELSTGCYPWDIHDFGIDFLLEDMQARVGNNAAYLLALMHHEKRPLHQNYYPHNPHRKMYMTEDSRCYFNVHDDMYKDSKIKPLHTERDFLKDKDWLQVFVDGMRKHGMSPGAEFSHTPLDIHRMTTEYADCMQVDIYGNKPGFHSHTKQQLCWNSPVARAYVCALTMDMVKHYDIDMILYATLLFNPGQQDSILGAALGGCFCKNCEEQARKAGLDWNRTKQVVRELADIVGRNTLEGNEQYLLLKRGCTSDSMFLLEYPEFYQWLKFRCDSITNFMREVYQAAHSVRANINVRYNTCWPKAEFHGLNLKEAGKYVDSLRVLDYAEQDGNMAEVLKKDMLIANARRQIGENKPIIATVAPRGKASIEMIKTAIKIIADSGADGLNYAFYDCSTYENLNAVKEGIAEAGIIIT